MPTHKCRPSLDLMALVDSSDILLKGCKLQMKRVDEGGPAQSETESLLI